MEKTLDELNREIKDIQNLIQIHTKSLQTLQVQEAKHGLGVPLEIINQIDERKEKLETLQDQLALLMKEKELQAAPTVFIADFHGLPPGLPAKTIPVDNSEHFTARPRQLPAQNCWQDVLLPKLVKLPGKIKQTGLIRLQGRCSLPTASLFGQVFSNVGGRRWAFAQTV